MGLFGADSGNKDVRATIFLGCSLGLSFLFLILAAAIYHDYLPFINLAFVVVVPIAVILGDAMSSKNSFTVSSETSDTYANFGTCFFGTTMVSMFGLPLVLLHADKVSHSGFALWIASTILTTFSAAYYWIIRKKNE